MRPRCAISRHFPHRFADTKSVDMAGGGEHVHFRPVHEFCFVFFFESKRMESIRPGVKNTKISKAFPLNSGTCQIKSERDHAPSRPPPAARATLGGSDDASLQEKSFRPGASVGQSGAHQLGYGTSDAVLGNIRPHIGNNFRLRRLRRLSNRHGRTRPRRRPANQKR